MTQYYTLKENKIIHMNYVDQNTFLFKLFSSQGIEIEYSPELVSNSNDYLSLRGYDPVDFYHSMAKCLSANDAKSSSLVSDS